MKASKHAGKVVLMTVIALGMAIFSLTLPWYEWGNDTYWIQFESWGDYGYDQYPAFKGFPGDPVGEVMSGIMMLVDVWFILAVVFVGLCLIDRRLLSILIGAALTALSVLGIIFFAHGMPTALNTDGFIGGTGSGRHEPLSGFWLLTFACVIQVSAVLVRAWTVIPQLREPERIPETN
jgi:hypothetical protein